MNRTGLSLLAIEPTERALWLCGLLATLSVVSAVAPVLFAVAGGLSTIFVIALAIDYALTPAPLSFGVQRFVDDTVVVGQPFTVVWRLRAPSTAKRTRAYLTDTAPSGFSPRLLHTSLAITGEGVLQTDGELTARRRGDGHFGRVSIRTEGPLCLLRRRHRFFVDDTVCAVPDLSRIRQEAVRSLRSQLSDGRRARNVQTAGRELDSLRKYARGDDVRLVDWKASARRDTLIVKKFQPETHQDVILVLDAGQQLDQRLPDGHQLFDDAHRATLVTAAAALSARDRVGVVLLSSSVDRSLPPRAGIGQLRRIADALNVDRPTGGSTDYAALVTALTQSTRRRALIMVFTDVVDQPSTWELANAVARLTRKHHVIVVAVGEPLAPVELSSAPPPEEIATGVATKLVRRHRLRAMAALRAAGATVVDGQPRNAAVAAVTAYCTAKLTGRIG